MIRHGEAEGPVDFRAAGCFCAFENKLLLIERQDGKPFARRWGIPTGKIEPGETARDCVVRELREEVGLEVATDQLSEIARYFVDDGERVFTYTAFALLLEEPPHLVPKFDEVRQVAWVEAAGVSEIPVVPYFFNTLDDFLDWRELSVIAQRLQPEAEARTLKR